MVRCDGRRPLHPGSCGTPPNMPVVALKERGSTVRIFRYILMVLALTAMVAQSASAFSMNHVDTVSTHSVHRHHDHGAVTVQVQGEEHHHGHRCPSHHHDGKCCDSACCGSTCLSALDVQSPGGAQPVHASAITIPVGDDHRDGTILGLADRPPITV